jgi:hypothetical protein
MTGHKRRTYRGLGIFLVTGIGWTLTLLGNPTQTFVLHFPRSIPISNGRYRRPIDFYAVYPKNLVAFDF